jgi:hypothetical protein
VIVPALQTMFMGREVDPTPATDVAPQQAAEADT